METDSFFRGSWHPWYEATSKTIHLQLQSSFSSIHLNGWNNPFFDQPLDFELAMIPKLKMMNFSIDSTVREHYQKSKCQCRLPNMKSSLFFPHFPFSVRNISVNFNEQKRYNEATHICIFYSIYRLGLK